MSIETKLLKAAVAELGVLRFWPKGEAEANTMMKFFDRMVNTPQQLRWLVDTLIDQVGTYDGTDQIRAVFCSQFQPKDGIQAYLKPGHSLYKTEEEYEADWKRKEADEREQQFEVYRIAASDQKLLAGDTAPDEPDLAAVIAPLAGMKAMPAPAPTKLAEVEYAVSLANCERAVKAQLAANEAWLNTHAQSEKSA
jgi:hypothetical protein